MANGRGSHQRPAGGNDPYQQSGYSNGAYQRPANQQGAHQRPASQQGAYQQAGNQQDAYQRTVRQPPVNQGGAYRQATNQQYGGYQRQAGYTPQYQGAGQYPPQFNGSQNYGRKRKHPVRNALLAILVILVLVGAVGGFTAFTLYQSAQQVKSEASSVMSDISVLSDQVMNEQPEAANATARDIAKRASNMKSETSGWAWNLASYVPVIGSDVQVVRDLSGVLEDLAEDALIPLVAEASQLSVKSMISSDGTINVEQAQRLVNALDNAAPIITQCADKIEKMPDAHMEQINAPLQKAKEAVAGLDKVTRFVDQIAPTFSQMLGADGQTRTYLIVAQSNAEIRSTGGFPGSIGPIYMTNGHMELGDFMSIAGLYPNFIGRDEKGGYMHGSYDINYSVIFPLLTPEEDAVFGNRVATALADTNFIPDWQRVSEIYAYAWEYMGYGKVQGVIGIDPVFLQDLLGLTGASIETPDGTVVDGTNAARLLLHDAYYLPTEQQDPFFESVAALSFEAFLANIGNVSMTSLVSQFAEEIENRRFMVWMDNANEERAMEELGCDAKLPHDETHPTVGFYVNDEAYSKVFWYFKVDSNVGDPTDNPDGSKTYPVTVTYYNMINDESDLSVNMITHNAYKRSDGDMIETVLLSAPEGGRISDVQVEGYFTPENIDIRANDQGIGDGGAKHNGTMMEGTLQGLDFWYGVSQTLPGESNTIRFNVTTSPNATEPLKFIRTATAQEAAGW